MPGFAIFVSVWSAVMYLIWYITLSKYFFMSVAQANSCTMLGDDDDSPLLAQPVFSCLFAAGSRPGTPSAKEALARMVSSRLYAGGKSDIPEMAMPRSGLSPIMSQGPRSVSPGGQGVPPMSSAAGLPAVPHSMGMPTSGPGRAGLGPGVPGQSGMGHTSMGMVHPGIPVSHAAMTSSGMPHPGMPHPGTVPHPGHDSSGMPSGGIPSGGIPNPAMATTGMGMPAVPSSMHMQMSGAGMPPHHPPPQHAQAQFPPGE